MISPDLAMALLVNRTAAAYTGNAPAYIAYRERTHVSAPALGRSQEIDRYVEVRVADDYAVMQDLPRGAVRTGEAFPIIPYFDPFSSFEFSYYANLKSVDITLSRGSPIVLNLPPPDPSVNVVVPYNSYWDPQYAPDSTAGALHLLVAPTPRVGNGFYPSDVVEDPVTRLPSRIVMTTVANDETIAFDFRSIDGYWVIVRGTFTAQERVGLLAFRVVADVTYDEFSFPKTPPDPRLAATP
ncbi:MAG: hypothetical protein ACYDG0_04540 [Vulcanimicrobiaceae bacterium]